MGYYRGLRVARGTTPGLGEESLTCVDACIQVICRHPELYAKVYEDYRRALVRRFPYAVSTSMPKMR